MNRIITKLITLFLAFVPSFAMGQGEITTTSDSLSIEANSVNDTLAIKLATNNPKVQMSFLMQGFSVHFCNEDSAKHCYVIMPNAGMVRHLLPRHPNEVKASLTKGGVGEIRPDLQPLITALNAVPTTLIVYDSTKIDCKHNIALDKDKGIICFSVDIPRQYIYNTNDSLNILIESRPSKDFGHKEYSGARLSRENQMPTNGLGNAPQSATDSNRIISIKRRIMVH